MYKFLSCLLLSTCFSCGVFAQDPHWTLQSSVRYALDHNIDLQQSVLNARLSRLQWEQSRLSQIPNASATFNYGKSFGRSVDPTSNQFINSNYNFAGLSSNVDVLLFGWFQKRKSIQQNKLSLDASMADYEQLQNDISLNVATAFLRILLAKEQVAISAEQMKVSALQQNQTKAFVTAGRSPQLDLAQIQSQAATDSAAYFTTLSDYQHALLDMKALMNLDIANPFEVTEPNVSELSLNEITINTPEQIYEVARSNFPSIKSNSLKVAAAQKGLEARKAALYPQLGLGMQLGSNYASTLMDITDARVVGASATGNFVDVNGTSYSVMQPDIDFNTRTTPFFKQFGNNFRQTIALNLTVPLFNGWTARTAIAQAKVDIASNKLEQKRGEIKLKQDVYGAYYDAKAAAKKYFAAQQAADAAARALDFAQKRYQLGLMNAFELVTTQNTSFKSKSNAASAKYELIFKLKVIDYYLGKELKL